MATKSYIDSKNRLRRKIVWSTVRQPGAVKAVLIRNTGVSAARFTDDAAESIIDESSDLINFADPAEYTGDIVLISITDTNKRKATHELFESKDGVGWELVAELSEGELIYRNTTYENQLMRFKVRAKIGNDYSDFTFSNFVDTTEI